MTKLQHYVTKLRLSKLCHWLIALCVVKLTLFVAMVVGLPVPELRLDMASTEQGSTALEKNSQAVAEADTPHTTRVTGVTAPENSQTSDAQSTPTEPASAPEPEPQGAAAAQAAAAAKPLSKAALPDLLAAATDPRRTPTQTTPEDPVPSPAPVAQTAAPSAAPLRASTPPPAPTNNAKGTDSGLLTSGIDTGVARPKTNSGQWWRNIVNLDRLPVPSLGVEQVAHAAALDTPPSPSIPPSGESSPFVPPNEQIPRGQGADGAPLPPRSTTARPLPAGSSLPQGHTGTTLTPPPTNAPAPNVNAYVPPEDPNRQSEELARREQDVLMLKQQMEQRLQELQEAEKKVQGMLNEAKDVEAQKVKNLVGMYVNMKPKTAAQALESMDERIAARILMGMTPKQSGEILSYANPQKAAKLTELLSRMQLQ